MLTITREQQDKLWNELSEESKKFILNRYNWLKSQREIAVDTISWNEYQLGLKEWEEMYGPHNLNPTLTYKDINAKLYEHKANIIHFMNTTSIKHEKKINAINKLLEVAKYLNGDWKPDWENGIQYKWFIRIVSNEVVADYTIGYIDSFVYFRTQELAEQAVKILGEEIIRLALSTDY